MPRAVASFEGSALTPIETNRLQNSSYHHLHTNHLHENIYVSKSVCMLSVTSMFYCIEKHFIKIYGL